jgi:hypothetical protein
VTIVGNAIQAAAARAPAGDGGPPVVVSTDPQIPRLEWRLFDRDRFQVMTLSDVASFSHQLHAIGISRFVVILPSLRVEVLGTS